MKACLIAGAAILAASTAHAEDCATIVEQIKRQEASIAEYEKTIEKEGFADESLDEMYRSGVEQAHELMKALNRARAERVEAERTLEEIGESANEKELRGVVDTLRIEESVLQRHIDRLNGDLGLLRTVIAMQRAVEAKGQRLAEYITRAEEMGCKKIEEDSWLWTPERQIAEELKRGEWETLETRYCAGMEKWAEFMDLWEKAPFTYMARDFRYFFQMKKENCEAIRSLQR